MGSPRVLVVEDEASVQTTLCAALALLGFITYRATDVEQALRILGSEHIDAITLDVCLPHQRGLQWSGLSLLAFLRSTPDYVSVPVLVFTGTPLSPQEETLVQRHDAQVFYKPQRYSVLVEHLTRALGVWPLMPNTGGGAQSPAL
jgi:CheY-like chemotaxis protein